MNTLTRLELIRRLREDAEYIDNYDGFVGSADRIVTTLLAAVDKLVDDRDALEQARLYVEGDELAHGRSFGTGNAIRAALNRERTGETS